MGDDTLPPVPTPLGQGVPYAPLGQDVPSATLGQDVPPAPQGVRPRSGQSVNAGERKSKREAAQFQPR